MKGPSVIKQVQSKIIDKEKNLFQNMQQLGRQLSQSALKLRRGEGNYVLKSLSYSFQSKSTEIDRLLTEINELKEIEFLLLREGTNSRGEISKHHEEKK